MCIFLVCSQSSIEEKELIIDSTMDDTPAGNVRSRWKCLSRRI